MKPKHGEVLPFFFKNLARTMFLVGAGTLFALSLSAFITQEMMEGLKRNISMPLQVIYATLIGFLSPEPRYIIYPILAKLREFGVSAGVLIALISGQVLIEPSGFFMEAGFFGWRFPVKRLLVSFILTFGAGILTNLLFKGL
jgi:uncharacterized membrane protein YraQ (UPF0718 family)